MLLPSLPPTSSSVWLLCLALGQMDNSKLGTKFSDPRCHLALVFRWSLRPPHTILGNTWWPEWWQPIGLHILSPIKEALFSGRIFAYICSWRPWDEIILDCKWVRGLILVDAYHPKRGQACLSCHLWEEMEDIYLPPPPLSLTRARTCTHKNWHIGYVGRCGAMWPQGIQYPLTNVVH